jgi:hypothetical protein
MGLDMYLEAKIYISDASWNKKAEEIKRCEQIREVMPEMFKSGNLNYIEIKFEVGYWRKANQIHTWFVKNVQDGEDDCDKYRVSRDDLAKLLEACKKVLEASKLVDGKIVNGYRGTEDGNMEPMIEDGKVIEDDSVASKILPTSRGFFFGSTEYNGFYYEELEDTIKIIEKALNLPKKWNLYYHSSW